MNPLRKCFLDYDKALCREMVADLKVYVYVIDDGAQCLAEPDHRIDGHRLVAVAHGLCSSSLKDWKAEAVICQSEANAHYVGKPHIVCLPTLTRSIKLYDLVSDRPLQIASYYLVQGWMHPLAGSLTTDIIERLPWYMLVHLEHSQAARVGGQWVPRCVSNFTFRLGELYVQVYVRGEH